MERLVEWNGTDKKSALPKCINEWDDTVWIEDICVQLATIYDILGDDYDLGRLRELVEADREGRCMVLPCKPGTLVWCIVEVVRYGYPDPAIEMQLMVKPFKADWAESIGKTVFLSYDDAAAKLKERIAHEN